MTESAVIKLKVVVLFCFCCFFVLFFWWGFSVVAP